MYAYITCAGRTALDARVEDGGEAVDGSELCVHTGHVRPGGCWKKRKTVARGWDAETYIHLTR